MKAVLRTDDILAEIRRERVRVVKEAPEPVVINIDAVLELGKERTVRWGAITLHAPPLSFLMGARLLVSAHALYDLRKQEAPLATRRAAQTVAAALLRQVLKPTTKIDRIRCWSCTFAKDDPEEVEGLLWWLITVPDEAVYQPAERKTTVDFMDNVAQFAKSFPAWVRDGWPMSWAHYQYGMRHLGRAWVRDELRQASAIRAGQTDKKDFKEYLATQSAVAGWS